VEIAVKWNACSKDNLLEVEEMPEDLKEGIIYRFLRYGDTMDCANFIEIAMAQ
jgi:hypothetical protein